MEGFGIQSKLVMYNLAIRKNTSPPLLAPRLKIYYPAGIEVVTYKVYKNIKLKNQTKHPFLLKVRYKQQRSEYRL